MPNFTRTYELTKFVLLSVLVVPVSLLSFIVPKKKGLLVFGSGKQKRFVGNTKYLFLYTSKMRKEYTSVFLTKRGDVYDELAGENLFVAKNFFKKLFCLLRAEYIFIETTLIDVSPFFFLPGNFKVVNLWHGTPLKKIEADTSKLSFFYRFATSFNNSRYYKIIASDDEGAEHMKTAFRNTNVVVTGFPRNDIFFEDAESHLNIRSKLNAVLKIDSFSKIILYAPTFRDNYDFTPFTEADLSKLNDFCAKHNTLFLIKEHPNKQSICLMKNFSHIQQVSKIIDDTQELLLISDLLVTDYSSIFFDFSLSEKPFLFYSFDLTKYLEKNRDMYYLFNEIAPPDSQCHSFDVLMRALDTYITNADMSGLISLSRNIKLRFNKYIDGSSSERVLNSIVCSKN